MGNQPGKARHIALIGMSNHDKSWWAERLASIGFRWICIDDLVLNQIRPQLLAGGFSENTEGMAAWMGMPWENRYQGNQARYLSLEEDFTRQALDQLDPDADTVIDTTGSVAHLSRELMLLLRNRTLVVCLDSQPEKRAEAIQRYLANPKPVAFVHLWTPRAGETNLATLTRCCVDLQSIRDEIYHYLAHVVLPYQQHRESGWTAQQFLEAIFTPAQA